MTELTLWEEVQEDLKKVETELLLQVEKCDPVLRPVAYHLVKAGGKRLRPAFAILAAKCCGASLEKVLPFAVALEMVHMATLVHDDVIDVSPIRRGQPTAWARWGRELSLHAGDYLFARSLLLVSEYKDPHIISMLAPVSMKIVQGEMRQLLTAYDINITLREYLGRIYRKTALLIASSCQIGAMAAEASTKYVRSLYLYGRNLGMAYQITDDVLDMTADPQTLGKPVGGDLRQGIITLPAIYALKSSLEKERLASLLTQKDKSPAEIKEAIKLIRDCGGIKYALQIAERYLSRARRQTNFLPKGRARSTLIDLTYFIKTRSF